MVEQGLEKASLRHEKQQLFTDASPEQKLSSYNLMWHL